MFDLQIVSIMNCFEFDWVYYNLWCCYCE